MARQWKEMVVVLGVGDGRNGGVGFPGVLFLVILATLSLISVVIFSCADGASKDRTAAAESNVYSGGCAAGCGAECGA
uniref:Uncharacterized protein n=1 Tax=Nelumbo nucifera TaxID=4432 RepID=A0A822YLK7_NELNU|nr:TPA_asm: hypothetical protein HUJ06_010726 [Nelumbo nucifera]